MVAMPSKQCRVCGDTAIGFNFNVISCNSCKIFFRRHALHQNFSPCLYGGECIIDKSTRKECKKCRFKKCLEIGMKKDIIFSRLTSQSSKNQTQTQSNQQLSDCCPLERIFKNSTQLKNGEFTQLLELRNAANSFPNENNLPIIGEAKSVLEIATIAEQTDVLRVIKFCKSFNAFKHLNQIDQLIMLKHFYPERAPVTVSYSYDMDRNGLRLVDKTEKVIFAPVTLFKEWDQLDANSIFPKFVRSLHLEMENDATIRDLILAQLLFRPRHNILHPEFVRYHHILYHYLLRRYLEDKYADKTKAKEKYMSIMEKLNELDRASDIVKQTYAHIQTEQSNQLDQALTEIYSLI